MKHPVYPLNMFSTNDLTISCSLYFVISHFQVKEFFAKYPEAGAGSNPRKQALETITNNIKWRAANMDDVFTFLKNKYPAEWLE